MHPLNAFSLSLRIAYFHSLFFFFGSTAVRLCIRNGFHHFGASVPQMAPPIGAHLTPGIPPFASLISFYCRWCDAALLVVPCFSIFRLSWPTDSFGAECLAGDVEINFTYANAHTHAPKLHWPKTQRIALKLKKNKERGSHVKHIFL